MHAIFGKRLFARKASVHMSGLTKEDFVESVEDIITRLRAQLERHTIAARCTTPTVLPGGSMRRFAMLCCAAALVGCAKTENKAPASSTPATPPPPAPIALADVAGKWTVKAMNQSRDTTLVTYQLTATADTTGWSILFPNRRQPVPVRVGAVAGDSIVIDAGPYESVLRKGVQVTTHGVFRLRNGVIVGTTVAHYKTTRADSVRNLVTEGTRMP